MRKTTIALIAALMFATVACGGGGGGDATTTVAAFTGDPVRGLELYRGTCIVCHGEGGIGMEGLGKPWVGSQFINERTEAEMLAFLQVGRPVGDPLNTTGVAMLPRGGNPNLTDEDLIDLIAYMRTLNL